MARVRKISRSPAVGRNYYLVDANFLADKHIPAERAKNPREADPIRACQAWWREIDAQLDAGTARVFVPDVCIAEAFKVIAKKYYRERWFPKHAEFNAVRTRLSEDIRTPQTQLKLFSRPVRYHDISTNRDIVIGVDRFFELFYKHGKNVQIVDLILISTAKHTVFSVSQIPQPRLLAGLVLLAVGALAWLGALSWFGAARRHPRRASGGSGSTR